MRKKFNKVKNGVASFYIVAFSTLILVIIATSFAMVVMSDMNKTANDDLSQSAYDSAMTGLADAKIAYTSYSRCKEQGIKGVKPNGNSANPTCSDIVYWVEHPDCYMVGHILGKIPKNVEEEVNIGDTIGTNGTALNQAYTCASFNTKLSDYRATLDANHNIQVVNGSIAGGANNVKKIRLKWFSVRDDIKLNFFNYNKDNGKVIFPAVSGNAVAVPPTVELRIVQTGVSFNMKQFDYVDSGKTNRATLYLVPTDYVRGTSNPNYINVGRASVNSPITASQVAKTNDRFQSNKPFLVTCDGSTSTREFYCEAVISLPGVIGGGTRSDDTFMVAVSLPYQQPDTDFSIEFLCDDAACGATSWSSGDNHAAIIQDTQIEIDVTGRANDLVRRIMTRLDTSDTTFNSGYPSYALQILGGSGSAPKKITTTREYDNYF